jgi:hypothetical protein
MNVLYECSIQVEKHKNLTKEKTVSLVLVNKFIKFSLPILNCKRVYYFS